VEPERTETGTIARVLTILLTSRECPWRCVMCDLWKSTTAQPIPLGAIPAQIDQALAQVRRVTPATAAGAEGVPTPGIGTPGISQVKLYNSGSFFDPRAVPPEDHPAIAERARLWERVIVECHPALVDARCLRFRDLLARGQASAATAPPRLEIALGLETANAEVLEKLNKRMTLDQFRHTADFLRVNGLALRVFVLVRPPFLDEAAARHWAQRSIDFAFDCGATAVALIPVRAGNGALDALAAQGRFAPPRLASVEAVADYGVGLARGRVFVDLWDLERFSACPVCFERRRARLQTLNLHQTTPPPIDCPACGGG